MRNRPIKEVRQEIIDAERKLFSMAVQRCAGKEVDQEMADLRQKIADLDSAYPKARKGPRIKPS